MCLSSFRPFPVRREHGGFAQDAESRRVAFLRRSVAGRDAVKVAGRGVLGVGALCVTRRGVPVSLGAVSLVRARRRDTEPQAWF